MKHYISKTAELFAELLESGSLSASSVDRGSSETKAQFAKLSAAGIISKRRSGGGNRYEVLHPLNLQTFISSEFPSGLLAPSEFVSNRTLGVLTKADSKTSKSLDFDLVMLRGNAKLCINQAIHYLKDSHEIFPCIKITDNSLITIDKTSCKIITIENPTVFAELNKISDLEWDVAVYTAGKMSSILLNQLQQWCESGHQLTHFGDYDYVGLLEYVRILARIPSANLHQPSRLDKAFIQQYGNVTLLQKQISQHKTLLLKLQALPESAQKQSLLRVYQLIQSTGKGLEQEAFLTSYRPS